MILLYTKYGENEETKDELPNKCRWNNYYKGVVMSVNLGHIKFLGGIIKSTIVNALSARMSNLKACVPDHWLIIEAVGITEWLNFDDFKVL